jgi:hypothetical protein
LKKIDLIAVINGTATAPIPQVSKKWAFNVVYEYKKGGVVYKSSEHHTMTNKLHAQYLPSYIATLLGHISAFGNFYKIDLYIKGVK